MTGAQILIEALIEQGVDVIFGYPGGSILNIHDALLDKADKIRFVLTSHEQGAAHAADGYARSSGRVGVCMATSGPGATNLVTGIANAYMDSVPIVAITGNVQLELIGRDSFQEVDTTGITMPITKHNYIVKDVADLADTVREAFIIARQGRPGPVLIDIPKDVTAKAADFTPKKVTRPEARFTISEKRLERAVALINESKRPLIYSGGGVVFSDASDKLKEFLLAIDAPAVFSMMGLSALKHDDPQNLGMVGMHGTPAANRATIDCDLLIAIGARFSDRVSGNRAMFAKNAKIIHIDIDSSEQGKNVRCDVALTGDAKRVLDELIRRAEKKDRREWNEYLKEYADKNPLPYFKKNSDITMRDVVKTLSRIMDDDALIVTDVGQHQMICAQNYEFKKPKTFISSGGLGTMGFGLGAAIGAKVANPERQVVLLTGDGSFHMNMNELACVVSENLPITVIVLNNSVLGMVRQWQRLFYSARYAHTNLARRTDIVKLAEAFGAKGFRVERIDALKDALKNAISRNSPCVVDVKIHKDDSVFPIIPPGGSVSDMILKD
ncbi:MAG: biosynthetic-type acetolactate synthase large subunit [Clostridiales bacterium]|jgi:acetolactate synthase-1/2/3 large subunit|nr:biosynthetic-type acetolactate synthase large subunit [Clostridiales bacterium]